MGKTILMIFGSIVGGFAGAALTLAFLDWGTLGRGQPTHADPTRADFVDLWLSQISLLLTAIGVTIAVAAMVVGFVTFKTIREVKDEAASAASAKVDETLAAELAPGVDAKVAETLPSALEKVMPSAVLRAILEDGAGYRILSEMVRRGEFDEVLERALLLRQNPGRGAAGDDRSGPPEDGRER